MLQKKNSVVKCSVEIFILSNSEQETVPSYATIESEHFGLGLLPHLW